MATLNKWRFAGLVVIYLIVIPAAIIYIAVTAQTGLRNDRRQDAIIRQHVAEQKEEARKNCERSYALLTYFLAANAISTTAGSPYAPLIRPELNRLIARFNTLNGCPPLKR